MGIIHNWKEILLLALVYYLTAKLGLLLAIPPGYATAIWPPAGVALAAVLRYGYGVAPGILIGSFLANVATTYDPSNVISLLRSFGVPTGIALGATLQAMFGALLIHRYVGFPTLLDRERDIIKFLGLGGVVSSTGSATVGVTVLFWAGIIPAQNYLVSWWTWFMGDAIGVLVVLPLLLTVIGLPRRYWHRRQRSVALPLLVTYTAIISIYITMRSDTPSFLNAFNELALLATSLTIVGLLGAFLLLVSGHAALFEKMSNELADELEQKRQTENALRQSDAYFRALANNIPQLAWISDESGHLLWCNQRFQEYRGDTGCKNWFEGIHTEHVKRVAQGFKQCVVEKANWEDTYPQRGKNGVFRWFLSRAVPVMKEHEDAPLWFGAQTDITEQIESQEELRKFRFFSENANDGHVLFNQEANLLYVNKLTCDRLGYAECELCQLSVSDILPMFSKVQVLELFEQCKRERMAPFESLHQCKDGTTFPVEITSTVLQFQHEWLMFSTVRDITERKQAEKRILDAAQHDMLTGLPNRALIFEYAQHLLAAARRSHSRFSLLFVDLDRFKPINDLYGHETGDRLLREIATRLRACVRFEDLVGRFGGDEFIVICSSITNNQQLATVAKHILHSIEQPFLDGTLELAVSCSIGISQYPQHGNNIDTLVRAADIAMYQAKRSGRANYQFFTPQLNQKNEEVLSLEVKLKRAMKNHGLTLYYQPVINMNDGRCIGAEALLRMNYAGELLGPERFIPVAETAGLIVELGEWVATEACRQHEIWIKEGMPPITIAINVSPLQFRQQAFVKRLTSIVKDAGINTACFQIEVTESLVMESVEQAIEILQWIKALGIKVALDDFGTGYSSLSYLSHLPIDKLKIDQSFIKRVTRDPASQAITEAILALGHALKLEVVGEGIETEEARTFLQNHGCDQAQGYLFCHPLPAREFALWYQQH